MKRFFNVDEMLNYLSLATTVVGQIVLGDFYLFGQGAFAVANAFRIIRDFRTHAETSDFIRDFAFFGLSIGMMLLEVL